MNDLTLSLAVCRIIYFLHFNTDMPDHMTYQSAANRVFDLVDWKAFDKLVAEAKALEPKYLDGSFQIVESADLVAAAMQAALDDDSLNHHRLNDDLSDNEGA